MLAWHTLAAVFGGKCELSGTSSFTTLGERELGAKSLPGGFDGQAANAGVAYTCGSFRKQMRALWYWQEIAALRL